MATIMSVWQYIYEHWGKDFPKSMSFLPAGNSPADKRRSFSCQWRGWLWPAGRQGGSPLEPAYSKQGRLAPALSLLTPPYYCHGTPRKHYAHTNSNNGTQIPPRQYNRTFEPLLYFAESSAVFFFWSSSVILGDLAENENSHNAEIFSRTGQSSGFLLGIMTKTTQVADIPLTALTVTPNHHNKHFKQTTMLPIDKYFWSIVRTI